MKTLKDLSDTLKRMYKTADRDYFSFGCFRDTLLSMNGVDKNTFFIRPETTLTEEIFSKILSDASLLLDGYPIQYYTGETEFFGLQLYTHEKVLIPRTDTEIISRYAVEHLPENGTFADICCGSGCIGIAVLAHRNDVLGYSFDISDDALDLTERNASRHLVFDRMRSNKCDVLSPSERERIVSLVGEGSLDAVLSNPPYIKSSEMESLPENVKREPPLALDGGKDGTDFYGVIASLSHKLLKKGGFLFVECGYGDEKAVIADTLKHGFDFEIKENQYILFVKQ